MKRRGLLAGLTCLALLFGGPARAAEATWQLRIASPDLSAGTTPSGGPLIDLLYSRHLIEDAFAAEGVSVQWHFFKGAGPLINEALSNQQLDVAFLGDLASIIGRAGGLQTRLLMATGRATTGYLGVLPGSGIQRIADLKGKRVGILRGTADHLALVSVLASAGLSERDVQLINLDFNAVNAALAARQIDATWAPSRILGLKAQGLIDVPLDSRSLDGLGTNQGGLIVTQALLDAHPEAATRLASVVAKALDWLSRESNRQAQIDLAARQSGYPPAVFAQALEGGDLRFIYSPLLDPYYRDTLERDVQQAAEAHLIRRRFSVVDWLAPTYLDQALQQTGLANAWQSASHYRWAAAPEPKTP
ncbi:MAG: putative aliphatic sulfonates-binding protein [Pseudomonas citronellolis]|nr:MAG: putative aliphatic sulfonates-binding protein [Pseudomonas citronellolis]